MIRLNFYPRLSCRHARTIRWVAAVTTTAAMCAAPVQAATDLEALISQTASTMASAEYAAKNCPNLEIDETKLASLVTRSGKTRSDLRADEDYEDQVAALRGVEKTSGKAMVCLVLPAAHGGYGRDVIRNR